jgi:type IV pilus assembly protein PilP
MKKIALIVTAISLSLTLTGCFSDNSDLKEYVVEVQKSMTHTIEPMPEISKFSHFDYSANSLRSPFVVPKPQAIQEKIQQMSGCLSPDPRRRKQPLEKYSLGDLTMRGTLGEIGIVWALVEASDNTLHRVSVGNYLGLFNGRITEVNNQNVKVVELIPDGAGCWVEREATIVMVESGAEGQRK